MNTMLRINHVLLEGRSGEKGSDRAGDVVSTVLYVGKA